MPTGDRTNPESEAAAMASKAESAERSSVERAPDPAGTRTPERPGERLGELAKELDALLGKADMNAKEQSDIEATLEGSASAQLAKASETSSSPEIAAMRSRLTDLAREMKDVEAAYSTTLRTIESLKQMKEGSEPANVVDGPSQETKDAGMEAGKELDARIKDLEATIDERTEQLKELEAQLALDEEFVGGQGLEDHLAMQRRLKEREASGWTDTQNTRADAPGIFEQDMAKARKRIEAAKDTIPAIKDRIKGFTTALKHAREDRDRL